MPQAARAEGPPKARPRRWINRAKRNLPNDPVKLVAILGVLAPGTPVSGSLSGGTPGATVTTFVAGAVCGE